LLHKQNKTMGLAISVIYAIREPFLAVGTS